MGSAQCAVRDGLGQHYMWCDQLSADTTKSLCIRQNSVVAHAA